MPNALKPLMAITLLAIIIAACLPLAGEAGATLVPGCSGLERAVVRETRLHFGLSGSPARTVSQIQAESSCRPGARNRSGSRGLAQFMPSTARWISRAYNSELKGFAPYSIEWSIRSMLLYDKYHYDRLSSKLQECPRWGFALAAYNAGEGAMDSARRRSANPSVWFGGADKRAPAETRRYVNTILRVLEPAYITHGWQGQRVC